MRCRTQNTTAFKKHGKRSREVRRKFGVGRKQKNLTYFSRLLTYSLPPLSTGVIRHRDGNASGDVHVFNALYARKEKNRLLFRKKRPLPRNIFFQLRSGAL